MMEWKIYKLEDVIENYIPGDWGNEAVSEESPCAVSCVRGADIVPISQSEFNDIPKRYISRRSFDTKCLEIGDIIIEKSGGSPTQSTGRVSFVSKDLLAKVNNLVCSNFCVTFRVKKEWNPLYVFYYFQFIYNQGVFFNFEGKTSGIKNLQMDNAFKSIPITWIPNEKQGEIVSVFSSIDKKISLNRAINRNLEAMAKQLYDYWFVQFDFPDANGKPYKSSGGKMVWNEKLKREIPEGWEVFSIGDILDPYPSTKRYPTDEYLEKGLYPIIDQGDQYIVGYTNEQDDLLTNYPAILFGDHSTKVKFLNFEFARGSDGTQIIYSKDKRILPYYLYLSILRLNIPNPGYSRHFKYLKNMPIVAPNIGVSNSFETIVKPMYEEWTKMIFANLTLSEQRDELLPLLMNGQVTIKN